MPLRPILKKNLVIRSNQTGTTADNRAALDLCAQGKVVPQIDIISLQDLDEALNKMKSCKTLGKFVIDLSL